ncbi:MAG: preprotein translocase subunit SecE [Candidatus Altimarinota bacterium]
MKNFFRYFKDSAHELTLVTWPSQEQLLQLTVITVVFVLIAAAVLGLVDLGFNQAYLWLLSLNG